MKPISTLPGTMLCLLILHLFFGSVLRVGAADFPDRIGEMALAQHDLAALHTEVIDTHLKVTVVYGRAFDLLDLNFGNIFIDGDLNPDTGVRLGADCIVEYILSGGEYAVGFLTLNGRSVDLGAEGTSVTAGTNSVSFSLPLSLWGGSSSVRLFAGSAWTMESSVYDRVPDAGWLETASGLAVFPQPGAAAVQAVLADSATDAVFPNLTSLSAAVEEGDLRLWLTFAHGIERADLQAVQDVLVVHLGLDLDQRLWSGFRNGREVPPTFGMDRDITLMLSDLFNRPSGSLRWQVPSDPDDPTGDLLPQLNSIGLGGQSSDTRFIVGRDSQFNTASNQLFLSIPLGYLGHDEGEMFLSVAAFLESDQSAGSSDVLPDSGAVDTSIGLLPAQLVYPVAACAGTEAFGSDGVNDSFGFGLQGDEIISSHACALNSGGLQITADLESLEISDVAFVNLFVDADGDAATGIALENGTPEHIGADFYLSCSVAATPDPGLVTMMLVDLRDPPLVPRARRVDALVSLRFGGTLDSEEAGACYSITLPPELLGPVGGATVRYVLTTTQQSYSAEDRTFDDPPGPDDPPTRTLIITNPYGMPSLLDTAPNVGFYTVDAPADRPLDLAHVVPNRGPIAGGTAVTLYGSGFRSGAVVQFDQTAVPAERVSSGELSALAPPHAAGDSAVSVRNPGGGGEVVKADAFAYGDPVIAAPSVWQVDPSLGAVGGGTSVQLHGLNFVDGCTVRFAGSAADAVSVLSPLLLFARTPLGQIGAADVEVENPNGALGRLPEGYNYGSRPPDFWTLIPQSGPVTGGTFIAIVGDGFVPGLEASLGGVPVRDLEVVSDRLLFGFTPAQGGALCADLTLRHADGARRTVACVFDYGGSGADWPEPSLLGVTPMSSPTEGGEEISILGTGFQSGAAVFFDGYPVPLEYFSDGLLMVHSPAHDSGLVPVMVINPDGQNAELPADQEWNSFAYSSDEPFVRFVTPMSSPTVGGEEITLIGSGFKNGATIEFGGVPGFGADVDSASIAVTTPPHPPGPVSIEVTNPNGKSYLFEEDWLFGPFNYVGPAPAAPAITSVAPDSGPITGGTCLTLSGSDLYAGARVFFGAQEAASVDRIAAGTLAVTSPPALQLGPVDLIVRNADHQQGILPAGFTFVAPTPQISGVTPASGPTTGGTRVIVSGSGFLPGSRVEFGGNAVVEGVYVNEHTLNVSTPPGFPGEAALFVRNPGGVSGELVEAFSYEGAAAPAPKVQAVLPASGPVEGGTSVSVIGQNFLVGLGAGIGGQAFSNLTVHSTRLVTGISPAGQAGAFAVGVTNQDGQVSAKLSGFIYLDPTAPRPLLVGISPASGPVAGGTDVVVSGLYFQPGSRVYVDRAELDGLVFVSAQELRGQTPVGTAGSYPVLVWNPDGQTNLLSATFLYQAGSFPVVLLGPACVDSDFSFSFQTQRNFDYTVQYTDDLSATNWLFHQLLTGDGSQAHCLIPTLGTTQRFFRVRQP